MQDSPSLDIDISKYKSNFIAYFITSKDNPTLTRMANLYAYQQTFSPVYSLDQSDQLPELNRCKSARYAIEDYISCISRIDYNYAVDKSILAVTFDETAQGKPKLTGHWNNQPYHGPPLALNYLTNTLLKFYAKNSSLSIRVKNYPLPRSQSQIVESLNNQASSGNIAGGLTFGFAFLLASFAVFLIKVKLKVYDPTMTTMIQDHSVDFI
jgi:hypothetical protein